MNKKTKPFPIWATLFTLLSSIILCSLGSWQIVRLEWKQDLLASLAEEYDKNAQDYPLKFTDFASLQNNEVKRGVVSGHLLGEHKIFIHGENQGYDVYVPLSLDDNDGHILVNLGWVDSNKDIELPSKVDVIGSARLKGTPWRFGIKNAPDKGEWVYLDIADVSAHAMIDELSSAVFYAEEISPEIENVVFSTTQFQPNNNHLKYAIFWFTMCFVMLVVFYKRFFYSN